MSPSRKMLLRLPHSSPPSAPPQYPSEAVHPNAGHRGMQSALSKWGSALNHVGVFTFAPLSPSLPAERTSFLLLLTPTSSKFTPLFLIQFVKSQMIVRKMRDFKGFSHYLTSVILVTTFPGWLQKDKSTVFVFKRFKTRMRRNKK